MNLSFRNIKLSGFVLDVGGARSPDYFDYFDTKDVTKIKPVDGSIMNLDFEKDELPEDDGTVDTVLLCNVLEHVYNHMFLMGEIYRVLKIEGRLVGFVPFLINYHPDPHDYFRYTGEAISKIMMTVGFVDVQIKEVGGGPFYVNYNNLVLSVPKIFRPFLFIPYFCLDKLFLVLRPEARKRYPLGYTFYARKSS
jgi:SAM-dependent methyltransferase